MSQLLPLVASSLNRSGGDTAEHQLSGVPAIPDLGVPAEAIAALSKLSPLTAIGASLPPPSLLLQAAASAAAVLEEFPPEADTAPATTAGTQGAGSGEAAEAALNPDDQLFEEQQAEVDELQSRDREVRQHEQAHLAAAGGHARGGASYDYTTGPDGKRYATGGEVSIDTSSVSGDPQATIRKAQQIYRAALAPAEPSGQDRSVASQAKKMEMEARRELSEQQLQESAGSGDAADAAAAPGGSSAAADDGESGSAPTGPQAAGKHDAGHMMDLFG